MGSSAEKVTPVQVNIFHQTYTLRASGDPRELLEVADMVDQLMSAIAGRTASGDSLRVAVLSCLHLADRLRGVERELAVLKERVEKKSEQFATLLDQAIKE